MPNEEIRRLDKDAAALRRMNLSPTAVNAAIAAIERERAELVAGARGNRGVQESRARRLLARLPEIVEEYRGLIRHGIESLAQQDAVEEAREATRKLPVDGRMVLAASVDRTQVTGPVHFKELGEHVLELAGWQRRPIKPNSSGGTLSFHKSLIELP